MALSINSHLHTSTKDLAVDISLYFSCLQEISNAEFYLTFIQTAIKSLSNFLQSLPDALYSDQMSNVQKFIDWMHSVHAKIYVSQV